MPPRLHGGGGSIVISFGAVEGGLASLCLSPLFLGMVGHGAKEEKEKEIIGHEAKEKKEEEGGERMRDV